MYCQRRVISHRTIISTINSRWFRVVRSSSSFPSFSTMMSTAIPKGRWGRRVCGGGEGGGGRKCGRIGQAPGSVQMWRGQTNQGWRPESGDPLTSLDCKDPAAVRSLSAIPLGSVGERTLPPYVYSEVKRPCCWSVTWPSVLPSGSEV